MASLDPLLPIVNDTPASATPVAYNFELLRDFVGASVVHADGQIPMTGPLTLPGPGTAATHAATVGQIATAASSVPTGAVLDFAGATAPFGYVLCDGSTYSSTDPDYASLFAVIGTTYGDPGGGNFQVPDFRKRSSVGVSPGVTDFGLGDADGAADSVVVEHNHGDGDLAANVDHDHGDDFQVSSGNAVHSHNLTGGVTSGSAPHTHQMSGGALILVRGASGSNDTYYGEGGATISTFPETQSATTNHGHGDTFAVQSDNASHGHGLTGSVSRGGSTSATVYGSTGNTGVSGADTNYSPYIAVNKIIRT